MKYVKYMLFIFLIFTFGLMNVKAEAVIGIYTTTLKCKYAGDLNNERVYLVLDLKKRGVDMPTIDSVKLTDYNGNNILLETNETIDKNFGWGQYFIEPVSSKKEDFYSFYDIFKNDQNIENAIKTSKYDVLCPTETYIIKDVVKGEDYYEFYTCGTNQIDANNKIDFDNFTNSNNCDYLKNYLKSSDEEYNTTVLYSSNLERKMEKEDVIADESDIEPSKPKNDDGIDLDNFCQGSVQGVFTTLGWVFFILKILIPILLIIFGSMDFAKAVLAGKDDAIKKSAKTLMLRTISGIIIFFIPTILNAVVGVFDDTNVFNGQFGKCTHCIFYPHECKGLGE